MKPWNSQRRSGAAVSSIWSSLPRHCWGSTRETGRDGRIWLLIKLVISWQHIGETNTVFVSTTEICMPLNIWLTNRLLVNQIGETFRSNRFQWKGTEIIELWDINCTNCKKHVFFPGILAGWNIMLKSPKLQLWSSEPNNPPKAKRCGDNTSDIPLLFLEHLSASKAYTLGSCGVLTITLLPSEAPVVPSALLGFKGAAWRLGWLPGVIGPETCVETISVNLQQIYTNILYKLLIL